MPIDDAGYANEVTMHNPAGLFVSFLKQALARQGIKVTGKVRSMNWLDRGQLDRDKLVELGSVASLPLRDIVREVQKPSQNLYTDLLLAHVGEQARTADTPAGGTSEELELGRA